MSNGRLTLPRFFGLVVGGLALLAGGVLLLAVRAAGRSVISTAETARASRASAVASAVEADLGVAEHAMEDFEQALAARIVDAADSESVRRALTGELIALRTLTDLTLTSATLESYDSEGEAVLAPTGRRQLSVFRERAGGLGRRSIENVPPGSQTDPTLHDTFRAAASRDARGRALWSDLAYSELDRTMARGLRRKTMTVQKAIFTTVGASTRFVGVLRAGIVSDALDRIGAGAPGGDPHQLFICDSLGRLITRLSPDDPYVEVGPEGQPDPDGDLRVAPRVVPGPVAAALSAARQGDRGGQRMNVGGRPFLLTLVPVAEGRAQQWLVGIVVPESHYVGELSKTRDRLLVLLSIVVVAIMVVGLLGARTIGRGVGALVHSTDAMRRFSFQPAAPGGAHSLFVEIGSALESVERAKTALRAMVKYVPIDLVRRLYESGMDPTLGAELTEVTLMFTDIADFTTHAESLTPARLAEALGRYLQAATEAVEATGGTVDKYIGDALMVLWNAPERLSAHATAACRAALGCAAATRALGESAWWLAAGLPFWRTRFGLHTGRVLVGNFGAPDRLSYTAMGDGVNLAARLEGLNKIYGTTILVSEDTRAAAGNGFVFRQIDRVAVKGKTRAVAVYELVGLAGEQAVEARRPLIQTYEQALAAAVARRFDEALALVDGLVGTDGPSQVLAHRCRIWLAAPPPAAWDGTWTATAK